MRLTHTNEKMSSITMRQYYYKQIDCFIYDLHNFT